ncbi:MULTISPECIES: hypothetical protein [unclassified Erwinia]|uniref:hypothetical protein n=1 Tax=unclassified Erwinia TaxID=2622719 RepID=UPI00130401C3|nr:MULTISPECIES: hypothetical protein [unclassified Erwinia]
MVVLTDYNRPHCKHFAALLEKIIKNQSEIALILKRFAGSRPANFLMLATTAK